MQNNILKIDNIGSVSISSYDKILEAYYSYENLSDENKKEVSNYQVLKKAENIYDSLKNNQEKAIVIETENSEIIEKNDITQYEGEKLIKLTNIITSGFYIIIIFFVIIIFPIKLIRMIREGF